MTTRLQRRILGDGRLHLQDGPIDLIIAAWGEAPAIRAAYAAAAARMGSVLDELCEELPQLRAPADADRMFRHPVARRMQAAILPHARNFITPMAAVAGAVADEVLAAMLTETKLQRAYVNNGGDIALHLEAGESFVAGLVDRPDKPNLFGKAAVQAADKVRGIATSGWRGRSFSLGIADAVSVLAACAADADAAATMIANVVDLPGHPAVTRVAAGDIDPASDLGHRLVTRGVAALTPAEIAAALSAGSAVADSLVAAGTVHAAALHVQGQTRFTETKENSLQEIAYA
jgi:ApbE superfamily uncharacterized protein (UPF0280 family)